MKILIIGNGFDIAHGLPTRYIDFLRFLQIAKQYMGTDEEESDPDDELQDFVATRLSDERKYGEPSTGEGMELTRYLQGSHPLLDHFQMILRGNRRQGKDGWVDFETEIGHILQALNDIRWRSIRASQRIEPDMSYSTPIICMPFLKAFAGYDNPTKLLSDHHFERCLEGLYNEMNTVTYLLEIYLREYVEKLRVKQRIESIENIHAEAILSFNYTHTYKKLYDPEEKAKYCYIHGETQTKSSVETSKLVLGIDEYLEDERRDKHNDDLRFKKFYQRIFKNTDTNYFDWVPKEEEDMTRTSDDREQCVYFYGHSLAETDGDIIRFFLQRDKTQAYIFSHNRSSLADQITNLVKIIGQDDLIKMTNGAHPQITFNCNRR